MAETLHCDNWEEIFLSRVDVLNLMVVGLDASGESKESIEFCAKGKGRKVEVEFGETSVGLNFSCSPKEDAAF